MSEEICPICGELIEHGGTWLDGTPIPAGSPLLAGRPVRRLCLNCKPYTPCPEPGEKGEYDARDS